jgi:hypothetical protein
MPYSARFDLLLGNQLLLHGIGGIRSSLWMKHSNRIPPPPRPTPRHFYQFRDRNYLVASGLADQPTFMPWFGDKKLIIQFA